MEVDAKDVRGLPLLAKPAPRQSYTPTAGKPAPSSHEPPRQGSQAPVTRIYISGKLKGEGVEEKAQSKSRHSGYKTFLLVFSQFACRVRPETLDIISTDKTTLPKPLATTQLAQRPISKHKNIKWQPTTGSTFLQTTWMVIFSEFITYF